MEIVVPSWKQHLLQLERMTKNEKDILLKLRSLRTDPNPPQEWISLSLEKEVLNRRIRPGGLPPGYIENYAVDQMHVVHHVRSEWKANWKTGAENFSGDSYHVGTLHYSITEIGLAPDLRTNVEVSRVYDFGNGHGTINFPFVSWRGPPWRSGVTTRRRLPSST